MGCGIKCLRMILITLNIIFFLAGAAILGVGIYIRVDPNIGKFVEAAGLESISGAIFPAAYVLIAFGGFTFLVGFCGCCGAIKESKCLIGIYITAVMVVVIAEIAGGVLVFVRKDSLLSDAKNLARDSLNKDFGKSDQNISTVAWSLLMEQFECCGYNNASDFINSTFTKDFGRPVPYACCKIDEDNVNATRRDCMNEASNAALTDPKIYNNVGCEEKLLEFVTEKSTLLMGIGIGIAAFELFVVLAAFCFCCNIDKDD